MGFKWALLHKLPLVNMLVLLIHFWAFEELKNSW